MFLNHHEKSYQLSSREWALSVATLSGLPYAKRHWDLANRPTSNAWGHRLVAITEALPIFGAITAVIERVVFLVKERFKQPPQTLAPPVVALTTEEQRVIDLQKIPDRKEWKPRNLSKEFAHRKMVKNAGKAIQEHLNSHSSKKAYATLEEVKLGETDHDHVLTFETFDAEMQGPRSEMEDAHFIQVLDTGLLAGVFDGHGGEKVAKYLAQSFAEKFDKMLKDFNGNVHQAFENAFDQIQEYVLGDHKLFGGSTAVISFIDKETHFIYTATLADSEANLYRKIGEKYKSIPLSVVRDWGCQKEADRAAIAFNKPEIATEWPLKSNPKTLRFPYYGLNVSRAFGDRYYQSLNGKRGVIHKPKITVQKVQPGDILILACDGLKDYVKESKIVKMVGNAENPAQALLNLAEEPTNDNVTIVAVKIK